MNFVRIVLLGIVGLLCSASTIADELLLKDGHPQRYVVQEGDTLWSISTQFLEDPWRWPEIWEANPFIDDPHLIFPGDVLVIVDKHGRPIKREGYWINN